MFGRKATKEELQDKIIKEMKVQLELFHKLNEIYDDEVDEKYMDDHTTNEESIRKKVYLQFYSIVSLFAQNGSRMCVNTEKLQIALRELDTQIPAISKDRTLALCVKDFLKSVANTLILILSFGQHSVFFSASMQPLHELKSALSSVLKSVETLEQLNASNEPSAQIVFSAY